jgi:uncharacterized delta-60 repeat protein
MKSPLCFFWFLAVWLVSSVSAPAVTINPDGPFNSGYFLSPAIVNGRPAIAWKEVDTKTVKYARALDANGETWGNPIILPTDAVEPANHVSLCVVDGNPAVCYADRATGRLKFFRALNAAGSLWGVPVTVTAVTQDDPVGTLLIVDGNPAICYGGSARELTYVRATDADGTAWGTPVKVDLTGQFYRSCMTIVQGQPAIAYGGTGGLWYVRASNAGGTAWGTRVSISPVSANLDKLSPSLEIVNGQPALAFVDTVSLFLRYVRSTDATGSAWDPVQTLDSADTDRFGERASLAVVDGKPAIGYRSRNKIDLKFLHATDANGAPGMWATPTRPEVNGNVGYEVTLLEVAGRPALFHADTTMGRVKYIRASTAGVTPVRWPGNLVVESVEATPAGNLIPRQPVDLGGVEHGDYRKFEFRLKNINLEASAIAIHSWHIDGPQAVEFSVTPASSATTLAPGAVTSLTVQFSPTSPGTKTAALHIFSDADTPVFDIPLTAVSGSFPGKKNYSFAPATGDVQDIAIEANGNIIISGVNGLSRVPPDGSVAAQFLNLPFSGGQVFCQAIQKDGKILVGGTFTSVAFGWHAYLVRINPDGTVDESFVSVLGGKVNPISSGGVSCILIQPDGKILAGGRFATAGDLSWPYFARLNADGSHDPTFTAHPDNDVRCMALQKDGKVLAGGGFRNISGSPVPALVRLNPDGTRDNFFTPDLAGFLNGRNAISVHSDGRILAVGGDNLSIARYFPGGESDVLHMPAPNYVVHGVIIQADGKFVISGPFTALGGTARNNMARLNSDDTLDAAFVPETNGSIRMMAQQADGKILLAGSTLIRLHNNPATARLETSGPSTIRWIRGGPSPEVRDVTFDVKPEGAANWTRLGTAAPTARGWELTGLTLPASGSIRAQAYAGGSVMESVEPIRTALESWRIQYFNSPSSTGDAADNADPDKDGLTNFTEFAFGLSPVDLTSNTLPEFKYAGGSFTASFTAPEGRENLLYGAERSPDMKPGTWTPIADSGTGAIHTFSVPATAEKTFVRYTVKIR